MTQVIDYPNLPQRLLKARDSLMASFRPILNHFGVTEQQWRIIRALDERSPLEPREMCELCQISSPSMAGVLARMEEMGLLERLRFDGDRRRQLIQLASAGRQLLEQAGPLINAQYGQIEQACGPQAMAALFLALDRFIELSARPIAAVTLPPRAD